MFIVNFMWISPERAGLISPEPPAPGRTSGIIPRVVGKSAPDHSEAPSGLGRPVHYAQFSLSQSPLAKIFRRPACRRPPITPTLRLAMAFSPLRTRLQGDPRGT